MTVTIRVYNSKDKMQKKFTKASWELAMKVLARVKGKNGWWARASYYGGNHDVLHYVKGEWYN